MSQTKAELIKGLNINASAPATALQIDASGNVNIDSNTLYVDATNNRVGLGTSSPSAKFQIGSYSATVPSLTSNSGAVISTTDTANTQLNLGTDPSSPYGGWIQMRDTIANVARPILLNPLGGNVGIGTSSPSSVFHARLPATTTATIATFDRSDGAVSSEIHYDGTDGRITFGTTTNHPLSFETNNTRAVTIDTSQRVGIGTTTPSATLDVIASGSAGTETQIARLISGTTTGLIVYSTPVGTGDTKVGLYAESGSSFSQNSALAFETRTSGTRTEKARLTSDGKLLVGTSTAVGSTRLQVHNGVDTTFTNLPTNVVLVNTGAIAAGLGTGINFSANYDNTNTTSYAGISGIRENATSGSTAGALVFGTRDAAGSTSMERFRISSAGYFAFASPSYGLYSLHGTSYNASSNVTIGVFGAWNNDCVNNGAVYNIEFKMHGSAGGQFLYANYIANGGSRTLGAYCTGTAWTNSSDIANKEEIVDTGYGLNTVLAMRPVDFRWKSQRDADGNGKPDIGFIAQEMETLVPEVVTGQEGSKGISYGNLVAVLTKAIQEQQTMITDLQAKVAALEGV